MEEGDLLTTEQAAKSLGVIERRVLQFIESGVLPATKLRREWVIRRADLEAFKAKPRPTGRPRSTPKG